MAVIPTIRIQDARSPSGFLTINKDDFKPGKHVLFGAESPEGGAAAADANVPEPITAGSDAATSSEAAPSEPIAPASASPSGEQSAPAPEPRKKSGKAARG